MRLWPKAIPTEFIHKGICLGRTGISIACHLTEHCCKAGLQILELAVADGKRSNRCRLTAIEIPIHITRIYHYFKESSTLGLL